VFWSAVLLTVGAFGAVLVVAVAILVVIDLVRTPLAMASEAERDRRLRQQIYGTIVLWLLLMFVRWIMHHP
jgi:hypothetical protein